ncbi:hypothetical protein [Spiroplasma endosymbiont of Polydrusus pterygomalis]
MKENNIQAEYVKRMRRKILIKQNRNKNIIKYPDLVIDCTLFSKC